jgi:hypothetical protein
MGGGNAGGSLLGAVPNVWHKVRGVDEEDDTLDARQKRVQLAPQPRVAW